LKPLPYEWDYVASRCEFKAVDGKVAMVVQSLLPILRVCSLEHLCDEQTANDPAAKAKLLRKLTPEIAAKIATMTKQDIFDSCLEEGVPCGKFNTREEMLADPQVVHSNTVLTLPASPNNTGGPWITPRPPAIFSKTPSKVQGAAPMMGADTADVLAEFGFTKEQVEALASSGVAGGK
jgi:crotonobetainyl-CoA:carnitine CoA-transferase CaiB-like acyl-CoA transferase